MKSLNLFMATTCLVATLAFSQNVNAHSTSLADDHAPIGVMGDHAHKTGELMLSYRYKSMKMEGLRNGTDSISTQQALNSYMMVPTKMTMDMHMFGAMYGINNDVTLMAMVPYMEKDMDMINGMGNTSSMSSRGLGDVKLTGLITLNKSHDANHNVDTVLLNIGASLPTGSIDEKGDTGNKLPYAMQLGSGTFDPIVRLGYTHQAQDWSWGTQGRATFRIGSNDEGYRLGNEYGATAWVAKNVHEKLSLSARLDASTWSDIHGQDDDLNPAMTPVARTDLRGGQRVDAIIGANFIQTGELAKDHRLAAEFGMPIYQDLDGPQLETDYWLTLGWQYKF